MQEVVFGTQGLNGIVHGAENKKGPVILAHGAGQGMVSPLLVKTANELSELGFYVLRFNFGYIHRKSAPSLGGKKEEPDLAAAVEFCKKVGDPILVGKSFGARVCANVALVTPAVKGLAFYGMPLQGASKTAKPRDWSHLARLTPPALFITGDKDKLCPLDELESILKTMSNRVESHVIPGDHSFKPKSEDLAAQLCVNWITSLG